MLALIFGGVGLALIGQLFLNWASIEGLAIGIFIVCSAWAYKKFRRLRKTCKKCYIINKKHGSYSNTISYCRDKYTEYIENKDNEDRIDIHMHY